jgi:hypothetical protein
MSHPMPLFDPDAPRSLVRATLEIRNALLDSEPGTVAGCCIGATAALDWRLTHEGWPVERIECSIARWPHFICRVEDWVLDPTAEQWGGAVDGSIVFQVQHLDERGKLLPRPPGLR